MSRRCWHGVGAPTSAERVSIFPPFNCFVGATTHVHTYTRSVSEFYDNPPILWNIKTPQKKAEHRSKTCESYNHYRSHGFPSASPIIPTCLTHALSKATQRGAMGHAAKRKANQKYATLPGIPVLPWGMPWNGTRSKRFDDDWKLFNI